MADTLGMPTGEKFKLENYETGLANMLNSFRKKNYLCDVVLVCRDREYLAHRIVLSAASPFFRHGFTEGQEAHTSHGIIRLKLKHFETFFFPMMRMLPFKAGRREEGGKGKLNSVIEI